MNRRSLPTLPSAASNPDFRAPAGDFFGFFGALKKGDFFWVHPKKVLLNKSFARVAISVLANASFRSLAGPPAYAQLRKPDRSFLAQAATSRPGANADFFWVHPKKPPPPPMRNLTPSPNERGARSRPSQAEPLPRSKALLGNALSRSSASSGEAGASRICGPKQSLGPRTNGKPAARHTTLLVCFHGF